MKFGGFGIKTSIRGQPHLVPEIGKAYITKPFKNVRRGRKTTKMYFTYA